MRAEAHTLVQREWGKQVQAARKALGLSQVALAERMGADQGTVSKIENGDYRLHLELLLRLCIALDLDPQRAFQWPPAIVEIARSRQQQAA